MRTLDRPLPIVGLDSAPNIAHWPVRPVIAIEGAQFSTWDSGGAFWDGGGWADEFATAIDSAWQLGPYTSPGAALNETRNLFTVTTGAAVGPGYVRATYPHPMASMIRPGIVGAQSLNVEIDAAVWSQNVNAPANFVWWLELSCLVDPATGARRNGSLILDDGGLTLWVGSYDEDGSATAGTFATLPVATGTLFVRFDAYPSGRMVLTINGSIVLDTIETTSIVYGTQQGLMSQWTTADGSGVSPRILRAYGGGAVSSVGVWDDRWRDATCGWTGIEIEHAQSDEKGLYPASRCVLQLDNFDGQWSSFKVDGTPNNFGPGRLLVVYATDGVSNWWLFNGRIARWDQRADDTVEIEAFDSFSDLSQGVGPYTPGTNGDRMGVRLNAILADAGETTMAHRFATGVAGLTAQETEQTPLEEMQAVCTSDGSILYGDADGTIVATDRAWRSGRSDQTAVWIASDNVCSAPAIVWDAVLSTNDIGLADTVVLSNIAGLKSTAGDINTPGGYVIAFNDQMWSTTAEGDALAAMLLSEQQPRRINIEEFTLYLLDPVQPTLWKAVDWRRLDQLRFLHDQRVVGGGMARIDVTTLIDSISHDITPDNWTMTVGTTRAQSYTPPILYNTGLLYDDGNEYGF